MIGILQTIKLFLLKKLVILHTGQAISRVKATVTLATWVSPLPVFIQEIINWTISNQIYILFTFGAIVIDHIFGSIVHASVKKDFTFLKNATGLMTKIALVVASSFLFEGINHIIKDSNMVKDYLETLLRLIVFIYPAGSAFMNMFILSEGKFPPLSIMKKISVFEKNADISEFLK